MLSVIGMAACGGGSSSNGGGGGATITSVTVNCNPTTLLPGQTSQCTATVTGTGNFSNAVTWSASAGTISSSGLFTAPSTNASLQVSVTATSTQDTSKSGAATIVVNPVVTGNVLPIIVDAGPTGNYVNGAFATVHICVPGTNNCQDVDHVLLDTGSTGLRIVSSILTLQLPQQKDSNGNLIGECTVFADGFAWGNVSSADIQMAGEKASSVPIQVIGTSVLPNIPSTCSSHGTSEETVQALGANGILGVGLFQQDCGQFCVSQIDSNNPFYYTCTSGTCTQATLPLASQVQNPVSMFATDNNGVLVQLPSVPLGTGAVNPTGSLIFGIDTQANNQLGSAAFFTTDQQGDFSVTFQNQNYPKSYIDSGSNGIYFLDSKTTGLPTCSGNSSSFYCPNSTQNFTATNVGANQTSGSVNFSIGNATNLFNNNPHSTAFVEIGGPNCSKSCSFDWGLPFFYGRPLFTVLEQHSTSKGQGPAWAY